MRSPLTRTIRHNPFTRQQASIVVLAVACLLSTGASPLQAEHQLLTSAETEQLGLEEAWRRHLSVPAGLQSIVHHVVHVHRVDPHRFVEVVGAAPSANPVQPPPADGGEPAGPSAAVPAESPEPIVYARYVLEVPDAVEGEEVIVRTPVSIRERRDAFTPRAMLGQTTRLSGGLLDRAEAERLARNDIRRLKRRGIAAEIASREVPKIRLYTLADDGTVECRDAESGELVWLRRVGQRNFGYSGMGVNDAMISVINGSELIKLDVTNGEIIDELEMRYVALSSAVQCGDYAVVPSIGNRIVAYPMVDVRRDVFSEIVAGGALSLPTKSVDSEKVAWGTSGGFVYVMELSGKPNVQFRLNADGIVSGSPAAAPGDRFFFGSESGQIYGMRATRSGEVLWSRPTGEPIYSSPVVAGDRVLFPTAYGNLYCVSAEDGYGTWPSAVPSIRKVLGVIGDTIFASTLSGSMVVISLETGEVVWQMPSLNPHVLARNLNSDRLYLVDKAGTIQCLKPVGSDLPVIRDFEMAPPTADELAEQNDKKNGTTQPIDNNMADPFGGGGGGADPFGAGGGKDPFAPAGDDPFAPAAGGADPFGDSPF